MQCNNKIRMGFKRLEARNLPFPINDLGGKNNSRPWMMLFGGLQVHPAQPH